MSKLPIIVVGMGGHAKVVVDTLLMCTANVIGATDPQSDCSQLLGISRIGDDSEIEHFSPDQVELVNGIGSVKQPIQRRQLFEKFKAKGYRFASVIHPSAVVSGDVKLGEGVQILAGTVVQAGSQIGENTILNTRVSVDHDCQIAAHVHVAPGATLCGGVRVASDVHIGTGACVVQGVRIGTGVLIGAGSVIVKDVSETDRVTKVSG